MKYFLMVLLVLSLVGCSASGTITTEEKSLSPKTAEVPSVIIPEVEEEPFPPAIVEASGAITAIPATYELSDKGAVGFEPGKYTIGNFAYGKEADLTIILHSDRAEPITFQLSYRTPSYTDDGYAPAPEVARGWLSFENLNPMLLAQEKREFMVTLCLPEEAEVPDKWEFWIAIKEVGQTSQVQTEGCIRVFVNMH